MGAGGHRGDDSALPDQKVTKKCDCGTIIFFFPYIFIFLNYFFVFSIICCIFAENLKNKKRYGITEENLSFVCPAHSSDIR